jgi:hypothetical protein
MKQPRRLGHQPHSALRFAAEGENEGMTKGTLRACQVPGERDLLSMHVTVTADGMIGGPYEP